MKILICTNGKKHSEEAIGFAGELFSSFDPEVTLLFVGPGDLGEPALRVGRDILEKYKIKAEVKNKESRDIAREIVNEADGMGYDFLVLGSRGEASTIPGVSSYVLGDVPRQVIRMTKVSTLIVKDPEKIKKVLIAVDGTEVSKEAVSFWGGVVKKKGSAWKDQKVNLLTVVPEFYSSFGDDGNSLTEEQLMALSQVSNEYTRYAYKAKMALQERYGVESRVRLREGELSDEVLREAEREYDLIVLGRDEKKERTFGAHLMKIVEQAKIPVLVVRSDTIKKLV